MLKVDIGIDIPYRCSMATINRTPTGNRRRGRRSRRARRPADPERVGHEFGDDGLVFVAWCDVLDGPVSQWHRAESPIGALTAGVRGRRVEPLDSGGNQVDREDVTHRGEDRASPRRSSGLADQEGDQLGPRS